MSFYFVIRNKFFRDQDPKLINRYLTECKHFHDEKPQKILEAEFDVSVVEFYNIFWSDAEFFSYLGRMQEFTGKFTDVNWQNRKISRLTMIRL